MSRGSRRRATRARRRRWRATRARRRRRRATRPTSVPLRATLMPRGKRLVIDTGNTTGAPTILGSRAAPTRNGT
eukprot:1169708-Prymnesium_polylepis.1